MRQIEMVACTPPRTRLTMVKVGQAVVGVRERERVPLSPQPMKISRTTTDATGRMQAAEASELPAWAGSRWAKLSSASARERERERKREKERKRKRERAAAAAADEDIEDEDGRDSKNASSRGNRAASLGGVKVGQAVIGFS